MFIKGIEFNYNFVKETNTDIDYNKFPFNLDLFKFFELENSLNFNSKVTFFVGENGSGKTTFIESLAYKLGLNKFGGGKNFVFKENDKPVFSDYIKINKTNTVYGDAFFFRAENFFNLEDELEEYTSSGIKGKELVYSYTGGGKNFREMSHGQGFKAFFENRLRDEGIYIFDEPESALSVQSQIEFLFLLKELSKLNNQIFIVTHSPIILAFPDAQIYDISNNFEKVEYKDTNQLNDYLNFFKYVKFYREELRK